MKIIKILNSIALPFMVITLPLIFVVHISNAKTKTAELEPKNGAFEIGYKKLDRTQALKEFFKKYNSPLIDSADTFVRVADQYGLDYRLLPSIACMESGCAKFYIKETHNPFGWGGGYIKFDSYDEAIENVGKGLNDIYLSRGLTTPELIAPVYTPPNHRNWLNGVTYFTNQIEDISMSSADLAGVYR